MKKQNNNSNRAGRIASVVQTAVAEILIGKFADVPASISGSESFGNGQAVRLFYYLRNRASGPGDRNAVQKQLDAITPRVRHELAGRLQQKYVSDIRFVYDDTLEKSERIDTLLANIEKDL